MKIGFFDSGLGGLIIMEACRKLMPDYDYIYLGDTLHVPYGGRSAEAIFNFSVNAVKALFERDCALIIMACNTASASALRRLQQEWLPVHYPQRRVLGVVVPTLEAAVDKKHQRIGLIATASTVQSDVYRAELEKINPDVQLFSQACPLLVPLIENDGRKWVGPILAEYLKPLIEQDVQSLILGCTHYPFLKKEIEEQLSVTSAELISQDDIIPHKLENYLYRHPEIEQNLSKGRSCRYLVTDLAASYKASARHITGQDVALEKIAI